MISQNVNRMMNKVSIETHLSLRDYVNVCFRFRYSRIGGYIATIIGVIYILLGIVLFAFSEKFDLSIIFIGVIYLLITHGLVYLKARSAYLSNKKLQENITYTFDDANLTITGQSFTATSSINTIYKVTSTKEWLFIWPNNGMANIISRKNLTDLDTMTLVNIFTINDIKYKIK